MDGGWSLSTPTFVLSFTPDLPFFYYFSSLMTYRTHNHTRLDNPTQGSGFHELVVLLTLAPHLARLYWVPGTNLIYNTKFAQNTQGMPL